MDNISAAGALWSDDEAGARVFIPCIEADRLARAYVPSQRMGAVWCPEKGLIHGTIYPELCMPYNPKSRYTALTRNQEERT